MDAAFLAIMNRKVKRSNNKLHYRCKTHTMSKREYEELSREIYIANCYLTAKEKRELPKEST